MDNSGEKPIGWLIIPPQETVLLTLDLSSLQPVVKHFSRKEHRYYHCFGVMCDFCMSGTPKRRRYQVHVIFDGKVWAWEFGKQVFKLIKSLTGDDKEACLLVTRIDSGPNTRYWITRASEVIKDRERERYMHAYIGRRLRT